MVGLWLVTHTELRESRCSFLKVIIYLYIKMLSIDLPDSPSVSVTILYNICSVLPDNYIVTCQPDGVSSKPPRLQAATRHGARNPLFHSQVD